MMVPSEADQIAIVFGRLLAYRSKHQEIMDLRVRILTEVINHIREVKLYAYETLFGRKVDDKRQEEMKVLRSLTACNAISSAMMYFIREFSSIPPFIHAKIGQQHWPGFVSSLNFFAVPELLMLTKIATFVVYSGLGNQLDAGKIFTSLQLLNILRQPIAWFPKIIAAWADFLTASYRIGAMLQVSPDDFIPLTE